MQESEIIQMQKAESNYWWHVSRRFILQSVLKKRLQSWGGKILDVGCGTGINLDWLRQFGEVTGVDSSKIAIEFSDQQNQIILGDITNLSVSNNSHDLVTAFDVLEHLKDDKSALVEWKRALKKSGYLFISVPAYQWLFGSHDKAMMHYRRYSLGQLLDLLKQAGFKPIYSSYFFMFTLPLFILQRIVAQISKKGQGYTEIPSLLNKSLIILGKIEMQLMKVVSLPFGSSILVLAQKND